MPKKNGNEAMQDQDEIQMETCMAKNTAQRVNKALQYNTAQLYYTALQGTRHRLRTVLRGRNTTDKLQAKHYEGLAVEYCIVHRAQRWENKLISQKTEKH